MCRILRTPVGSYLIVWQWNIRIAVEERRRSAVSISYCNALQQKVVERLQVEAKVHTNIFLSDKSSHQCFSCWENLSQYLFSSRKCCNNRFWVEPYVQLCMICPSHVNSLPTMWQKQMLKIQNTFNIFIVVIIIASQHLRKSEMLFSRYKDWEVKIVASSSNFSRFGFELVPLT